MQNIQKTVDLPHCLFTAKRGYTINGKAGLWGNAILSRHPFDEMHEEFTHLQFTPDYDPEKHDYNARAFQYARVGRLNLLNYHGLHNKGNTHGTEATEKHCRRIVDFMAEKKGAAIVSGDFNLTPDSASLKPLDALYENLCVTRKVTATRNEFSKNRTLVDYIWVSRDVTVNRFEVMPDLVSDHAALLLEFEV